MLPMNGATSELKLCTRTWETIPAATDTNPFTVVMVQYMYFSAPSDSPNSSRRNSPSIHISNTLDSRALLTPAKALPKSRMRVELKSVVRADAA